MSTESRALRVLRAFKKDVVPEWILMWTSFRCLLDRVLNHMEWRAKYAIPWTLLSVPGPVAPRVDKRMLEEQLDARMKTTSVKRFVGEKHTAKHARTETGVPLWAEWHKLMVQSPLFYLARTPDGRGAGLFARRNLTFRELSFGLYGWLCPIGASEYETLHANDHPSLFQVRHSRFILGGPLSCVNHACDAALGFATPCRFPRTGFARPPFDAHLLRVVNLTEASENMIAVPQDCEILVCYQDTFPACRCAHCKEKGLSPEKK